MTGTVDQQASASARAAGTEGQSVGRLLDDARKLLAAATVADPGRDARILLADLIGCEPGLLPSRRGDGLANEMAQRFLERIERRIGGEPVHRITGRKEFYGRPFLIGPDCLEPRPETELLVERVLEDIPQDARRRFADAGCGSGVIAVSLLGERPGLCGVASDIAQGALDTTGENARLLGVESRLELHCGSWLSGLSGTFDFIVSNPPYIASNAISGLQREVRDHDPLAALDGGPDCLDAYRALLAQSRPRLVPGGRLYLETGHDQHDSIGDLATQLGWGMVSAHLDLSGLERIVVLKTQ